MNINWKNASIETRSKMVDEMRKKRFAVQVPASLKDLCVRFAIKNCSSYLGRSVNSFANLPNTLIKEFFNAIFETNCSLMIPRHILFGFVRLLLNPNLIEFEAVQHLSHSQYASLFDHIINNCPNVTEILRRHYCLTCETDELSELSELSLETITKLKKIKRIDFGSYPLQDEHFRLLVDHAPNLGSLFVLVSDSFTMEGVTYLSKMTSLRDLTIHFPSDMGARILTVERETLLLELKVECAGRIPNLQRFFVHGMDNNFYRMFAERYPNKRLTLTELSLGPNCDTVWPANLTVHLLQINCGFGPDDFARVCSISCPIQELTFDSVPYDQVHSILNQIGANVRSLFFMDSDRLGLELGYLNLVTVIKACPNLDSLNFEDESLIIELDQNDDVDTLPIENFKAWKDFRIEDPRDNFPGENIDENYNQVDKIFKMYLLGSEDRSKNLFLCNPTQIKVVKEVLKDFPSRLKDTEKLYFATDMWRTEFLESALDVAKQMIFCSPFLTKIKLYSYQWDPVEEKIYSEHSWFPELTQAIGIPFVCLVFGEEDSSVEYNGSKGDGTDYTSDGDNDEMELGDEVLETDDEGNNNMEEED
ncbi:uncharacterized protein LOC135944198 [Cloeon dipterum]|uniref:uncharacterized protein LOC135944198 n=1 Tax=Cloeon dipterum TaxID=197152 RepID=UPI0032200D68